VKDRTRWPPTGRQVIVWPGTPEVEVPIEPLSARAADGPIARVAGEETGPVSGC
jgi:hypothetical protein